MTNYEILQQKGISKAKTVVKNIEDGVIVPVFLDGAETNFYAARLRGRMWVVGKTKEDIIYPDAIINGRPAKIIKP